VRTMRLPLAPGTGDRKKNDRRGRTPEIENSGVAKSTLVRQKTDYTETEVARVTLTHRPGELARAATRLDEAGSTSITGILRSGIPVQVRRCYFSGFQTPVRRRRF
jgi:hypothetical protein